MVAKSVEIETSVYSCEQKKDICFVYLNTNSVEIVSRVNVKDQFLATLAKINDSESIKGLVITNSSTYKGDTQLTDLIDYYLEIIREGVGINAIAPFKHSTLQLVEILINYTKPTIVAMNGDIGQVFFGFSLACDYRFATSNTTIHLPSTKLGLPTTGVLAYYLVQYLGRQKAAELLLKKTALSAPEGEKLGMITDIVTVEKLVEHCVEKIDEIRKYPIEGFLALKRVLQPPVGDIASFVNKSFEQFIIHLLRMKEKKE
mgnify:CR=1 FL=1